ncbi:uncharacterized protein UV8b_07534 [Ustilaginoidea virens]|uniref:Uncharacterized protein n=1 Tax=Ustilaginoidea virens TaxID=1159556 RepID=A0A8E5HXC7_USTVR|nr:uncharacterized protein UV8b_07534 [Ustilaginoidea virens]QUC23293.1 hypothetical protein UV8b_07534 [Ustilaginoidea virens]
MWNQTLPQQGPTRVLTQYGITTGGQLLILDGEVQEDYLAQSNRATHERKITTGNPKIPAMKFQLSFLLLVPLLGLGMADELPSLKSANEKGISVAGLGEVNAASICPPSYPRYCPVGGFCCRTTKCCSKSCCQDWAKWCIDGHCYVTLSSSGHGETKTSQALFRVPREKTWNRGGKELRLVVVAELVYSVERHESERSSELTPFFFSFFFYECMAADILADSLNPAATSGCSTPPAVVACRSVMKTHTSLVGILQWTRLFCMCVKPGQAYHGMVV